MPLKDALDACRGRIPSRDARRGSALRYETTLTPLADKYAKPVGWPALLRTLPRLRGALAPGSGGDAQGMLMHWLGAWVVRGFGLSAKEALQTYALRANETAL